MASVVVAGAVAVSVGAAAVVVLVDVSVGAGVLESSFAENHPSPELFAEESEGAASEGLVAAVAGGCVSAGAGVGVGVADALADAGSATGTPTLSLTTGAFANGSFCAFAVELDGVGFDCEWTSLTTGTV